MSLNLFSHDVSYGEKQLIIQAFNKPPIANNSRRLDGHALGKLDGVNLHNFVSSQSQQILHLLEVNTDFINHPPSEWNEIESYKLASHRATFLQVVNDTAERGVKLMQDFNSSITKCEEQKQYLLQVVEQHRTTFKKPLKRVLIEKQYNADQ